MEGIKGIVGELGLWDYAAMASPVVLYALIKALVKPKKTSFTSSWFLFNAIIIHFFLDVLVGDYGFIPPLAREYYKLDKRYEEDLLLVRLVCYLELYVMFPLCLLTYRATAEVRPERYMLQVVTSLVHIVGTYFFTFEEIVEGFPHVPADPNFDFTFNHIFYFWIFFVAANILWTLLPLYYVAHGWKKMTKAVKLMEEPKKNK